MIGLMIIATIWIPLIIFIKYWNKYNVSVTHVLGFHENCTQAQEIKILSKKSIEHAIQNYYRLQFTIRYNGETYYYNTLSRQMKWPIKWKYDDNDDTWIQKAELYTGTSVEDVTEILCKHGGPRGDFYNKRIKFSWIFPFFTHEYVDCRLKLYGKYDTTYNINLLTNSEENNKENELEEKYDIKLLDKDVEAFTVEEI